MIHEACPKRRVPRSLTGWLSCRRCGLHEHRRKVVFGRGPLPADLLFVGIGPGVSEDMIGSAFVGESGALLTKAITKALALCRIREESTRIHYANLVACHPTDSLGGANRNPEPDEILACRPLLAEIVALTSPSRTVLLSDITQRNARVVCPGAVDMKHPSHVLRAGGERSLAFRRMVRELEDVFRVLKGEGTWQ